MWAITSQTSHVANNSGCDYEAQKERPGTRTSGTKVRPKSHKNKRKGKEEKTKRTKMGSHQELINENDTLVI